MKIKSLLSIFLIAVLIFSVESAFSQAKKKPAATSGKSTTPTKNKSNNPAVTNEKEMGVDKLDDKKTATRREKVFIPYYLKQNFLYLNGGLFFQKLAARRGTTLPVYFSPEMIVVPNISVGIQFMYFQHKPFVENDYYTEFIEDPIKYNHYFISLKGSYHLNSIISNFLNVTIPQEKYDVFASVLLGYNVVSLGSPSPNVFVPSGSNKPQLGIGFGGRYSYSKKVGFFMEYGINSYSFGTLGITYFLGEIF